MKIPVTNTGDSPIYVAGVMIPGGETRHFEPQQVPPELRPRPAAAEEAPPADPLALLLAGTVKEVAAGLDALDAAELEHLEKLEHAADKPRRTLLEAIAAERLQREADALDGEQGDGEQGSGEQGGAAG